MSWGSLYRTLSVSEQLSTYPSPDPSSVLTYHQLTFIALGEGKVCSCLDIDTDLTLPLKPNKNKNLKNKQMSSEVELVKM